MAFRNQIVGLIRFSVVTTGDFHPGFDGPGELAGFLFDEARLRRRFALFETLTLPSLARQDDGDFTCLVLVADALPSPWIERLRDLLGPHRWARVLAAAPGPHYQLIRAAFHSLPAGAHTHRTTFRLDDDDAVDLGYISRLRGLACRVQAVRGGQGPVALAFNRGLYLRYGDGGVEMFDARERTPLSVGAALVAPSDWRENVYQHNHRALPQQFDCWSDAENFVFLRSLHRDNKSNPHFSGVQRELDGNSVRRILRERFGLQPHRLKGLFLP